MDFKLVSDYRPRGDQVTAIGQLLRGIEDGMQHQVLLGVTGSGKTYTVAKVIEAINRPALILAHNKTLAAQLYHEFRGFFPGNAVEYFVSYYDYYQPEAYVPQRDLFIEKDSAINEHIEQMRLSATKAILERRDCVIVGTVSAIYGIGDPSDYHDMILHLKVGDRILLNTSEGEKTLYLQWTSPMGGMYLFADEEGFDAVSLTRARLLERLHSGEARFF